jgi:hypothetical protein
LLCGVIAAGQAGWPRVVAGDVGFHWPRVPRVSSFRGVGAAGRWSAVGQGLDAVSGGDGPVGGRPGRVELELPASGVIGQLGWCVEKLCADGDEFGRCQAAVQGEVKSSPSLDRCVPGCGNTVRTDHHAAQLRDRAAILDQKACWTLLVDVIVVFMPLW